MFITLEDGFWNGDLKYQYINTFSNYFNKVTVLNFWLSYIMYGFCLSLFVQNRFFIRRSNSLFRACQICHLLALLPSQPTCDVLGTFPEGSLKFLKSRNSRGPSKDSQGTKTKIDDLMKEVFFRSNSCCFIDLFLLFTGKRNIEKF